MHRLIKTKAVLQIFLVITLSIFTSLSFAQPVEAQEVCCAQTAESFCQQADITECTGDTYYAGSCESFTDCQVGCCDLTGQGQSCTQATTKVACETQGGTFLPDELCNYNQCEPVCCQVGSQFDYTSQQECNNYADQYPDLEPQIHQVGSELECLELSTLQQTGCCSTQETCSEQTRAECQAMTGTFFEEELCSNVFTPSCNNCEPQAETACVEGSDDVWYFDSCGNVEGIAQECDVAHGKICGQGENNQATCIDINCADTWDNPVVDYDGGFRYNGESWCQYDANAGPGIDLPGSRHYKHYCYNGKEYKEPCADLRDEFCVQGEIQLSNDETRSAASCIENKGMDCYQQTTRATCENGEQRTCTWFEPGEEAAQIMQQQAEESLEDANLEENPEEENYQEPSTPQVDANNQGYCLPLVPPGEAFYEQGISDRCVSVNEQLEVPSYWRKNPSWNCITGCQAYLPQTKESMNAICQAQADCGAGYNLAGEWTEQGLIRTCEFPKNQGTEIEGKGKVIEKEVKELTLNNILLKNGGSIKEFLNECEYTTLPNPNTFQDEYQKYSNGLHAGVLVLEEVIAIDMKDWNTNKVAIVVTNLGVAVGGLIALYAMGSAIVGGSAGLLTIFGASLGLAPAAVTAATAAATAAGSVTGTGGIVAGSVATVPIVGWIIAAIVIVATTIAVIVLTHIKEQQTTTTFECRMWEPPSGGQYCNLCNEPGRNAYGEEIDLTANGLHECTEYLCKSLGAACDFVPDTPDGPVCVSAPQVGAPMRSSLNPPNDCYANQEGTIPAECNLQESPNGHTYTTYLGANQKVSWGITTEDYAKCRYDTQRNDYENMQHYFDQGGFSKHHNKTLYPSQDIWPGETYQYYVQCANNNEESTTTEYAVQFTVADQEDLTPPIITEYSIIPGSYTAADKDEVDLTITINEQVANGGGCKWAKTNVPYQEMGNHFNCPNPATEQQCTTTLGPLENQTNMFYLRCKDDKFPEGNINAESQPTNGYTLVRTQPLEINNVFCQTEFGTDCANIESNEFTLTVQTEGGALNGKATCGLGYNDIEATFDMFQTTETSTHTQELSISDEYFIFCTDIAENLATTSVDAQITFDYNAPIIEETFIEQGHLVVTTNEEATCKWTREAQFNFVEAQPFIQTGTKRHTIAATNEYVQVACQDKFGNTSPTHHIYINEL